MTTLITTTVLCNGKHLLYVFTTDKAADDFCAAAKKDSYNGSQVISRATQTLIDAAELGKAVKSKPLDATWSSKTLTSHPQYALAILV